MSAQRVIPVAAPWLQPVPASPTVVDDDEEAPPSAASGSTAMQPDGPTRKSVPRVGTAAREGRKHDHWPMALESGRTERARASSWRAAWTQVISWPFSFSRQVPYTR